MTDSYLPLYRGKIRAKHGNKNVDSCSFTDRTPLKRYIYHCINILGGKKGKSNLASRLELGILPLENYMRVQSVYSFLLRSRRGRDRMVGGFTTTYTISAYHHWCCEFESRSGWSVQHYVIKFVSDLPQVGGFIRVLQFPPPIKLTATIILLKSGVKHHQTNKQKTMFFNV
jgi:hypothetical protein